jgi:hypothetical protein
MIEPQRPLMFFEGREMYNNWEDARLWYLASGALAVDDADLLLECFSRARDILSIKMTDEGQLPRETMRTRSMSYTLFALDSMTDLADLADQLGEELYDTTVNGRGIRLAVDYAARHLLDMASWPFEMIHPVEEEIARGDRGRLGVFERAHARWGDRRYLDVIEKHGGRPVLGGHATLLCGA